MSLRGLVHRKDRIPSQREESPLGYFLGSPHSPRTQDQDQDRDGEHSLEPGVKEVHPRC